MQYLRYSKRKKSTVYLEFLELVNDCAYRDERDSQ